MAPAAPKEGSAVLTADDLDLLRAAFENFQGTLAFNWAATGAKLGVEAGNVGQATQKRFKRMCERVGLNIMTAVGGATTPAPATKKRAPANGDAADDDDAAPTPSKRRQTAKARAPRKKAVKEAVVKDEEVEEAAEDDDMGEV